MVAVFPAHPADPQHVASLRGDTPLIDVRAPVEYERGAIASSTNLPILNDAERKDVGTRYKQAGPAAAEALGHELVSGEVRAQRIAAWVTHCEHHKACSIMCFRGGQRSRIAQAWLRDAGVDIPKIEGGYKALRQLALHVLPEFAAQSASRWIIVGGKTGTRKTVLVRAIDAAIDLEGIARHRGSAFGAYATGQPSPATFENALAGAALRHHGAQVVLEDESRTIGRLAVPESWHARMQASPVALIEDSRHARVTHIRQEYIDEALGEGESPEALQARYTDSLRRITKRLGGARCQQILELMTEAFAGTRAHEDWIDHMLEHYYDPMYEYQLEKKAHRVVFRGDFAAVSEYLATTD